MNRHLPPAAPARPPRFQALCRCLGFCASLLLGACAQQGPSGDAAPAPPTQAPPETSIEPVRTTSGYAEELRRAHRLADLAEHARGTRPTPDSASVQRRRATAPTGPAAGESQPDDGVMPDDGESSELTQALSEFERTFQLSPPDEAPTFQEARRDLALRAARLLLAEKHPEDALTWIDRGLAIGSDPSPLRASLLLCQADALATLGRPAEAKTSLLRALEVNQQLLQRELEDP